MRIYKEIISLFLFFCCTATIVYGGNLRTLCPFSVRFVAEVVEQDKNADRNILSPRHINANVFEVDSNKVHDFAGDTVKVVFADSIAKIVNPYPDCVIVDIVDMQGSRTDITIRINSGIKFPVLSISGKSDNGSIHIDSETEYTLVLDGLMLASKRGSVLNLVSPNKVSVELANGKENTLCDAEKYLQSESTQNMNGCINSMGSICFYGDGTLCVKGNHKHAVYSKKSVTFLGGKYIVDKANADAFHSGKRITIDNSDFKLSGMNGDAFDADDFTLNDGVIAMEVTGEAAKGIKCSKELTINGGTIVASASGTLTNKQGNINYCTILKCDSNLVINGGYLQLKNVSPGGKCISSGHNMTINGGDFVMEVSGDGASYLSEKGDTAYYTAKCMSADDSLCIYRGSIHCLATGIGGKGIVGQYMEIGLPTDTISGQGPSITVETTNTSLKEIRQEDQRYGCPKAIKASQYLNIYSGNISVRTHGMGGEGIECGKEFYFYGGNLECDCFDDGINVGEKLVVLGGVIFCNSMDNDGIDSNNAIYLKGGLVVSLNQSFPNESLDAEHGRVFLEGASVFGLGYSGVVLSPTATPYYNIERGESWHRRVPTSLYLTKDQYIHLVRGDEVLLAVRIDQDMKGVYLTASMPNFDVNEQYLLYTGTKPINSSCTYFDGKLIRGGFPEKFGLIYDFKPITNK